MKKRIAIIGAAVLLTGVLLAACSSGPSSGRIEAKQYAPGYTSTVYDCVYTGKTCIEVPEQQYNPPEWQFLLKNGTQEGWVDVDETTYHQYQVGDFYSTKSSK